MAFLRFLFTEWSNMIYVVPLGIAVCYFLLSFVLGGGFSDAHADMDVHADFDAHADLDVHADMDAHVDTDTDHDFGHHDETEFFSDGDAGHDLDSAHHDAGAFQRVFIFMGVGKVPVSLIWQTFFISWGACGITCNTILYAILGKSVFYQFTWFVSIPVAFVFGTGLTKAIVQLWIKILPTHEQTASTHKDIVGSIGHVLSDTVTDEYGRASIIDRFGYSLDIFCKRHPTCRKKLKRGDGIIVIDTSDNQNYFLVGPLEDDKHT